MMASLKSLDSVYENIITSILTGVFDKHGSIFDAKSRRNTLNQVSRRLSYEGTTGFLTKTLPKLGKAFDKAISGAQALNATDLRLAAKKGSKLPRFLGELFSQVLDSSGELLPNPCALCVGSIRQICFVFYKMEMPYSDETNYKVISGFISTEDDLKTIKSTLDSIQCKLNSTGSSHIRRSRVTTTSDQTVVAREARILLQRVFASFDPLDVVPRHGPGAVAEGLKPWSKYRFTNIPEKISNVYPIDEYYFASPGHVCDCVDMQACRDHCDPLPHISHENTPAQVILVPKDSRGPRLISCEPVAMQWIQQGLSRAIVQHVESCGLTRYNVFFTDQGPNRRGALLGSNTGKYATLDLKEASDRVSLALVQLLFPEHLYKFLENCRSSSTTLPDGSVINLLKFAPMGSGLCFPIMALTIWSLLSVCAPDADTRESILVYGDDVIVPTSFVDTAIERLESFGLKINRDKSCTKGLFRESCGMDAFNGIDVTPVRIRTPWSSRPSPGVYTSWIAYANSFLSRGYSSTYELIAGGLHSIYGDIPAMDMQLQCPSLVDVPEAHRPKRRRWNKDLQKVEYYVRDVKSASVHIRQSGWLSLLRYFTQCPSGSSIGGLSRLPADLLDLPKATDFRVEEYTCRKTMKMVKRWR